MPLPAQQPSRSLPLALSLGDEAGVWGVGGGVSDLDAGKGQEVRA
jgi:hypothetical protein